MEQRSDVISRIGTFLILVGILLLLLFVASDVSGSPDFRYVLAGAIVLFLGYLLRRQRKSNAYTRFGTIRRAQERRKQRREQKKQQDQDQQQ